MLATRCTVASRPGSTCVVPRPHLSPRPITSPCSTSGRDELTSWKTNSVTAISLGALALMASPEISHAIQMEPANALSLPTWAIHVSSVVEWVAAMGLFWKYAEVSGNPRWKGLTWGMLPALGSAMSACTWHFFYNSPDLEFLVALQAFLTVVGNCTCALAAFRIWQGAQEEAKA
uniref:Ycf49-like protein n=1 Tax=Chlamydomonas leiostraca TaxID=1034604 RepID=A0A7S0WYT1_9CHLO|mmetsp:Transcript_37045/g.93424  ORF Transcript_37045/g.93424 Transcript_37045/m.93424 type:complete len:175 (+) Transcript_37045:20-544(+)